MSNLTLEVCGVRSTSDMSEMLCSKDGFMNRKGSGNETRFDGVATKIDAARNSAPGIGVRLKYTRWCERCGKDKPAAGAKQLMPGVFRCADCCAGLRHNA